MSHLVFDIETTALPFDDLAPSQQEYLLRGSRSDEERAERLRMMSLNPLTARVVAIAMMEVSDEGEETACVYSAPAGDVDESEDRLDDGSVWRLMEERRLLERFWQILGRREGNGGYHLVSFNGRGFDAPFLMLRSLALRVPATRNLMEGTRWRSPRHTDMAAELTFNSSDRFGPLRRFNFDFYCHALGIASPKGEGVTGNDVAELFAAGEHRVIAEYALRDVRATWELFRLWREFMEPLARGSEPVW